MRKAYLFLFLVPSAVVYACGGTADNGVDGGGDASNDTTTTSDSASDSSGNDAGSDASDGGKDSSTPPDGAISIACLHPADCIDGGAPDGAYPPSSGEVCCGTLVTSGKLPNCSFVSFATTCAAPGSCGSNIALSCGTDTVRGCQHASECVESNYDKCCFFKNGDAGAQFCASATLAGYAGAPCLDAGQ